MTMSVRFFLSYDCFKLDCIAFKEDKSSVKNVMVSWTSLRDNIYAKKVCNVWSPKTHNNCFIKRSHKCDVCLVKENNGHVN